MMSTVFLIIQEIYFLNYCSWHINKYKRDIGCRRRQNLRPRFNLHRSKIKLDIRPVCIEMKKCDIDLVRTSVKKKINLKIGPE